MQDVDNALEREVLNVPQGERDRKYTITPAGSLQV